MLVITNIRSIKIRGNSRVICDCECKCGAKKQLYYFNARKQDRFADCKCAFNFWVSLTREKRARKEGRARALTKEISLAKAIRKLDEKFRDMKKRTEDNTRNDYKYYGGRGVRNLWQSKQAFIDDMLGSFIEHIEEFGIENTSIDRINRDGHYCKENCRWATRKEQYKNSRLFENNINGRFVATAISKVGMSVGV